MKELIPVAFDDLHFKEEGDKVAAHATITLGLEGEWYELDLTEDHIAELNSVLSRWIKAANKPNGGVKLKQAYNYHRNMRTWANEVGMQDEYFKIPTGYKYSTKLRDAYKKYLKDGKDPE